MNAAHAVNSVSAVSAVDGLARELAALDRRAFLRWLGGAAAAGLLPAACSPARSGPAPPPDLALRALTPRTYGVLVAAAERVVGEPGAARIRSGEIEPGAAVEALLARTPELARQLGTALLVLEFGVYPLLAKLRPFTALDPAGRDAVLDDLMRSRWELKRILFKGVKSVSLLGYYGAAANQPASRLPGLGAGSVAAAMSYDPSR